MAADGSASDLFCLPQHAVLAAVRAPDGTWQHLDAATHPQLAAPIVALSASADGTLYLALDNLDGVVWRYMPAADDWHSFPDRNAAIATDYARIVMSVASPALWTTEGGRVWADWWVYDGSDWVHRPPVADNPSGYLPPVRWTLDGDGRAWIVRDGSAWRLSRAPGFALRAPAVWLAGVGETRSVALDVPAWEGYAGAVDVALDGLPAGVTMTLAPAPVAAGGTLRVTLTVAGDVPRGDYALRLRASAADGAAAAPLDVTLRLVGAVVDAYLPVVRRH